jgi:hypothetical protein
VTVIADAATIPSAAAVIAARPGASGCTTPSSPTAAISGAELDHSTRRPASGAPAASSTAALNARGPPTRNVAPSGVRRTAAARTGATVRPNCPDRPSTSAAIVAVPGATAVAAPAESTATMAGSVLVQITDRPATGAPDGPRGVATRVTCPPTTSRVAGASTSTRSTATRAGGPATSTRVSGSRPGGSAQPAPKAAIASTAPATRGRRNT